MKNRIQSFCFLATAFVFSLIWSSPCLAKWSEVEEVFFKNPHSLFNQPIETWLDATVRQDGKIDKGLFGDQQKLWLLENGYLKDEGNCYSVTEKLKPFVKLAQDFTLRPRYTKLLGVRKLEKITYRNAYDTELPMYGKVKVHAMNFIYTVDPKFPGMQLKKPGQRYEGNAVLVKNPQTGKWEAEFDDIALINVNSFVYKDEVLKVIEKPSKPESGKPPQAQGKIYEAEKARLAGSAKVNNEHGGYSGTGYVNGYGYRGLGSSTVFTVNVPSAGSYQVRLRYANATDSAMTVSIYVNGIKVKQTTLPNLKRWDTWLDKVETLQLNAGQNTIAYRYDPGDSGNINIDFITVSK